MRSCSSDGSLEREISRLHALAASLVGPTDAPDIVQDTWIAARTAGPKRSLGQWLRGIVRNKARLQRRATQRRVRREADNAVVHTTPAQPDETLATREVWDAIREELERLPDRERRLVEARFVHERSPTQIAEELGVPVGTIRSQMSRALARMRRQLAERHRIERGHLAVALGLIEGPAPSAPAPAGAGMPASFVGKAWVAASVGGVLSIWWLGASSVETSSRSSSRIPAPVLAAAEVAQADPEPTQRVGQAASRTGSAGGHPLTAPRDREKDDDIATSEGSQRPRPAALLVDVADGLPDLIAQWDDDLYEALFEPRDAEAMKRSFEWYREQLGNCGEPKHVGGSSADAEFVYECETGMLDAVLGVDDADVRVRRVRTGARGVPAPDRVADAARAAVGLHNEWEDEVFEARFGERYRNKHGDRMVEFLSRSRGAHGRCELGEVKAATIRTALYGLDCENGHRTLSIGVDRDDKIFKFRVLRPRTFDGS